MNSVKLAKLESLSEEQADHSRAAVERQRAEILMIDQHHSELKSINQEYQYGVVGQSSIAPQLLAHRRAFVAQLTVKLEQLNMQRQQQSQLLSRKMDEHREHKAQSAAIGAMAQRSALQEQADSARQEQLQQDEVLQAMRQVKRLNEAEDHV